MNRIRTEIWCLLGWTMALVVMWIVDEGISDSSAMADRLVHGVTWLVGLGCLHFIFSSFRRQARAEATARDALVRSEQRYRDLFEHMAEGFALHEMVHDSRGLPVDYRFLAVNPAFERLTGLKREVLLGRTVREVIPDIEESWIRRYARVVETGESTRFEQVATALGKVFEVEAFRCAPGQFACTFCDVTEHRAREAKIAESEARLSAMLQSMDDLVFVIDKDGRFREFAQTAKTGELLAPPSGFEGRPYAEVLPPLVADRLGRALERIQETGEVQSFEYELVINGRATFWSARVTPLRRSSGTVDGSVIVTRNVTMRRLDEEHLRQRNRFLEGIETISTILLGSVDEAATFDRVAEEVAAMTGFFRVVIALMAPSPEGARLRVTGMTGGDDLEHRDLDLLPDNSVSGRAVAERAPVVLEGSECVRQMIHARFRDGGFTRMVAVPILRGREALGSILVADCGQERVDPVLTHVLHGVANHIAIHLTRLETEKARHRNAVELASIYDHAPVIMAVLDESGEVLRANRAAQEFAGVRYEAERRVRPGELLGCLGSLYHPSGCGHGPTCSFCALRHAVLDTIQSGGAHRQVEVRKEIVAGQDIRAVDLLVSTAPIEIDGRRRVLLVMEDVTKARFAEGRAREQAALLDVTHDAIFVHDGNNRVLYWNKGAETLYRVPKAEAVGRRIEELFSVRTDGGEAWPGDMATGVLEVEQTTRDGRDIVVQSRRAEVRNDAGTVSSILVVNTDITENRRLNRHLLRAQRLESIGTLASGIAHDLNNILAPIMMSVGLLRPQSDDAGRAVLETIETCVRRGGDIVRQVLLFARGVDGQRVVLQPRHVLNEVLRIMRETFPRSISISTEVCRDPWSITGDPTQIQQVLLNICVNARDAMVFGGDLRVGVQNRTILPDAPRIHPRAEPGRYVAIDVTDTGTGIPPELLEKIFDPFFTTKPQGQGTGLGLATSIGIVEKHGGFIQVDSVVGRGSTFSVYLPACDAAPAPEPKAELPVPGGDGARILVVDDEPAVRKLVQHMLRVAGYRVETALDGQDCVDVLRADRDGFAVILTDLMMPRLDGGLLISTLRQMRPETPLIAMTGVGEERRVHEAMSAGVRFVLNKPFDAAELLRVIHRVRNEGVAPTRESGG